MGKTTVTSIVTRTISVIFCVICAQVAMSVGGCTLDRFQSFSIGLLEHILSVSVFAVLRCFVSLDACFVLFITIRRLKRQRLTITGVIQDICVILLVPIGSLSATAGAFIDGDVKTKRGSRIVPVVHRVA